MAVGVPNLNQNNGGISASTAGSARLNRGDGGRRPDELLPVSGAGPSSLHQHQSDIRRVPPAARDSLAHPFPPFLVVPIDLTVADADGFLQRVSIACYAERCISYDRFCPTVRPSDRLTVRHTLVSCQNDSSYDHAVFTGG